MPYFQHLGAEPAPAAGEPTLRELQTLQQQLLVEFRRAEERRKLSVWIAAGSAIFAAFRLGVLALPTIKARVQARRAR